MDGTQQHAVNELMDKDTFLELDGGSENVSPKRPGSGPRELSAESVPTCAELSTPGVSSMGGTTVASSPTDDMDIKCEGRPMWPGGYSSMEGGFF